MSLFLTISVSNSLSLLLQENNRCRKSSFKVGTDEKLPLQGGRRAQSARKCHGLPATQRSPPPVPQRTRWTPNGFSPHHISETSSRHPIITSRVVHSDQTHQPFLPLQTKLFFISPSSRERCQQTLKQANLRYPVKTATYSSS